MSVLSRITRGVGYGAVSLSILGYGSVETRTNRGGGWENYVAPRRRKTLTQYKKQYFELPYIEIEQEKEKVASEIRLAESEIRFNQDLGLSDVIARLGIALAIEKIKLQALEWVEKERERRFNKEKKAKSLDDDLVFIATYLIDEDD